MIVTKMNIRDELVTMDLPITEEQLARYYSGEGHVQDIFPELKACEREFLISATTPKMWEELFHGCTWNCDPCPYNIRHISDPDSYEDMDYWQGNQEGVVAPNEEDTYPDLPPDDPFYDPQDEFVDRIDESDLLIEDDD